MKYKKRIKAWTKWARSNRLVLSISFITVLAAASILLYVQNTNLKKEVTTLNGNNQELRERIDELKSENKSVERELESTEKNLEFAEEYADTIADLNDYLASIADELDRILIKTDQNSLDFINWLVDNGLFLDDGTLDEANRRYAQWEIIQEQTDQEYLELMNELTELMDRLKNIEHNTGESGNEEMISES